MGPRRCVRPRRGGILGLVGVLTSHWDACEADFQRFYRLDLRKEVESESPRRLWALVNNLPPDAAVIQEVRGPEQQDGTPTDPFGPNVERISPAQLGRWLPTG